MKFSYIITIITICKRDADSAFPILKQEFPLKSPNRVPEIVKLTSK